MNHTSSTAASERGRFVLRDAGDITRLIILLFTRWTVPRVEVRIDALPAVAVQLAQHRIVRILDTPVGGLGVVLAVSTVLIGVSLGWLDVKSMIWTNRQFWKYLLLIAVAALYLGVIGKLIGTAWTRARLMLELRRLRRQLVAGKTVAEPARYVGRDLPKPVAAVPAKRPADMENEGSGEDRLASDTVLSKPRPPKVLIRNVTDVKRLLIHLLTHWKLPRVRIDVDGVAPLEVQRAQHRLAHLSETCNCVLGACLAAAVILGGMFSVEWISSHNWDWWVPESWGPLGMVPVAALGAALTGMAIEMVWTRVKLMLVVHGVRHRLGALGQG